MANIEKLEISCLKRVIDSEILINGESMPVSLVKKITEMRAINGRYSTEDNLDKISSITVNYDGETVRLGFVINEKLHEIVCNKHIPCPFYKPLLHFVNLDEDALMDVDVFSKEDVTIVELTSRSCGWKWNFSLEVRYFSSSKTIV